LLSLLIWHFAAPILTVVFGSSLHSEPLLKILVLSLPFELCVSMLGTVFASQGYEKVMFVCLLAATALNISLNLYFIPLYQATATAWSTFLSYVMLFTLYIILFGFLKKERICQTM
jgi:O-antigen/teichoic acid export membrane protein